MSNQIFKNWFNISRVDPETVAAYRTVLPKDFKVKVDRDGDNYIACVYEIEQEAVKGLLITESTDLEQLIDKVNDLIYTYIDMPPKIRPYYGRIFTPEGHYSAASHDLTLARI